MTNASSQLVHVFAIVAQMVDKKRPLWLLLALLLSVVGLAIAQGKPDVTYTDFKNFPLFFNDATIYFYSVNGVVFVSHDEGKSWKEADGIPRGEAMMVIEHPFENSYAFVLIKGTRHYRTSDRGRTWQSFTMPVPPVFVPFPLSFHWHSDPS